MRMIGVCEVCNAPSTHTDSVVDVENSTQFHVAYRPMELCELHARERLMYVGNTTRIEPPIKPYQTATAAELAESWDAFKESRG